MKRTVGEIALIGLLRVEGAYTSDLELAPKFSPIVRFTEDPGNNGRDIRVTRPEPGRFEARSKGN